MSTMLLVRHGLTTMTGPVLAGRTPGIHLDERGTAQAQAVAARLAALPLRAVVTSPLERCVDTAEIIRDAQKTQQRTQQAQKAQKAERRRASRSGTSTSASSSAATATGPGARSRS